jgi:hypothetical protein
MHGRHIMTLLHNHPISQYPRSRSTTLTSGSPLLQCFTFSMSMSRLRSQYLSVRPLRLGVITTFLLPNSGWPCGSGSGSVTSSAAPARAPESRAASSASVSTKSPRPMLTTIEVGLRYASVCGLSICLVAGVEGRETRRTSILRKNAAKLSSVRVE